MMSLSVLIWLIELLPGIPLEDMDKESLLYDFNLHNLLQIFCLLYQ